MNEAATQCESGRHRWHEVYYGYECYDCDAFVPFGCEPWAPDDWPEDLMAADLEEEPANADH